MTTQTTQPHGLDLINQAVNFYRQYLDCSPEQLDLLALWTMHTHIIPAPPFSPALNICSRQKQSGKTLCLQLLSLLCDGPWMHTAAAPTLLLHQLTDGYEPFNGTLLLDDCDATFGKSRLNIKLQGLFTARFQQDARCTVRVKDDGEYFFDGKPVFFPAAFAGNGRLHPSLAERSILIVLEPKETGSACQPFRFFEAQNQSRSLQDNLCDWGAAHHERFEKIAPYKEDQFPPELSWRHRDCAEPLFQIADFVGGDWPQRARQALVNTFALAAFEDFYSSRQILSDIRDLFAAKDNRHLEPRSAAACPDAAAERGGEKTRGTKACPEAAAEWAPGCGEGSEVLPVAADSQNPVPNQPKLGARSQKPAASPVAANLQNPSPAISGQQQLEASSQKLTSPVAAESAESTNNQITPPASRAVAANLQNPSLAISGQQLEASSQKLTRSVAANLQTSVPKLGASSQKPAASPAASPSRPMWGADWTNTAPPTRFAGNVKKEGIGYRILKKVL
jgi:hypothetical protein